MKNLFAGWLGKKTATAAPPHAVPSAGSPVRFVWHRDAEGKPTGSGVDFSSDDGRGVMISGRNPDFGSGLFCMTAIIRRTLPAVAQRKAARWAGARFTLQGEPVWELEAEQRFAEAFIEYTKETRDPDEEGEDAFVPMALGRPPVTDEMRRLFADPYQESDE